MAEKYKFGCNHLFLLPKGRGRAIGYGFSKVWGKTSRDIDRFLHIRPSWYPRVRDTYRNFVPRDRLDTKEWGLVRKFTYFKAWKIAVSLGLALHYGQRRYMAQCLLETAYEKRGMLDTSDIWYCYRKAKRSWE